MTPKINYISIFDNLNVAVLITDKDLNIKQLNPSAESLLEISWSQALGNSLLQYVTSLDADLKAQITSVSDAPFTMRQVKWRLHNGEIITVDYTVSAQADVSDIVVEINSLDRLLKISREESLISSQETTRNLVRSMAHEIKNPLGGIRGAAQLLSRELPDPSLEEFTNIIIEEADRLKNLVDRMLGPRTQANFEMVNIHEVLEHVATVIKVEAGTGMTIIRDYDPSIPDIPIDRDQMIQVFLNIGRNAMQALREHDGENKTIILKTRIQRQFTIGRCHFPLVCRVELTDNGPGIPENLINDIFYPMITGRAEGTGLGLAIAQNLVQQHAGLVECQSQPGNTTFTIYLPMERNHATE